MDDFVHVFIHHGGSFVDDEFSSYEGIVSSLRCDVDKWSYFEMSYVQQIQEEVSWKEIERDITES